MLVDFIGALLPMVFFGVCIYGIWKIRKIIRRGKEREIQKKLDETRSFLQNAISSGEFQPVSTNLVSKSAPILLTGQANLLELKTTTVRRQVGTKVNIAGFPIYLGQSSPVSTTEMKETATGELGLSGKQLIFNSPAKTVTLATDKITSFEAYSDGFQVSASNRVKPLYFKVHNPYLWTAMLQVCTHMTIEGRKVPSGLTVE